METKNIFIKSKNSDNDLAKTYFQYVKYKKSDILIIITYNLVSKNEIYNYWDYDKGFTLVKVFKNKILLKKTFAIKNKTLFDGLKLLHKK